MTASNPLGLSQLEIASHVVTGAAAPAEPLPREPTAATPRAALEDAALRALARPPCVVSFSGGRDSSAVLATAVHAARREGVDLPIPVTLRFEGVEEADEASWQEDVVRHLGVREWERIPVTDELDMLGPEARRVLTRCGLLWPANSYVHEPLLRLAAGGSLLTGVDGDGILGGWRWQHQADVLAGRRTPRLADLPRVMHAASPRPVRRLAARRRADPVPEWLRPRAARAVAAAQRRERADEPLSWRRRVRWFASRRYLRLVRSSFDLMAAAHDVGVRHLFLDPGFLAACAAWPRFGPGNRTAAMEALFADALPSAVLSRETKARFGRAFGSGESREFVRRWSGDGIDDAVVDAEMLSKVWREDRDPRRQSMLLLHSVWLRSAPDGR